MNSKIVKFSFFFLFFLTLCNKLCHLRGVEVWYYHAGEGDHRSSEPRYWDGLAERGGGRAYEGGVEGGRPPAEEGES